jgi:hypothetical protein
MRANSLYDKEKRIEEMSRGSHNYAWFAKKMKPQWGKRVGGTCAADPGDPAVSAQA